MVKTIITTILFVLLVLCLLGLVGAMCALLICWLSDKSAFFLKLYLFFFEKEDYKLYKEVKQIFKNGDKIPLCSRFVNTNEMKGFYFIVHKECISLWKDNDVIFVDFHKFILDEFVKMGNLKVDIMCVREADDYREKKMHERIKQLEKEIAEGKARLAKLNEQDNA